MYLIMFYVGIPLLLLWFFRKRINWRHFSALALFLVGTPAIIALTGVLYSALIPLLGFFYLIGDWVPRSRGR